ncbi:MAG: 6,7-dimethyl-8-ribityllumazine synthase [Myxococcaceae bacterium]|nr:6,7-dimethyl-8-ribityllumazine synthase [Myxococcaceae bacterium]MBH2006302.1 6,7-dimethyl-8-ribityllumazine synthase [Myxococcaceae bacterium]
MSRFAIVASCFNKLIVDPLVSGAQHTLLKAGIPEQNIEFIWVPGALEIPITAQRLSRLKRFDAIVCLGAVIKGNTDHYEHVCREVYRGMTRVSLDSNLPITAGVLTVETIQQALERAGGTAGNAGSNAAQAAFDLVQILDKLGAAA